MSVTPLIGWRRVSPFRYLRINACLPTPRSISQATTSFIASGRLGIHHVPLTNLVTSMNRCQNHDPILMHASHANQSAIPDSATMHSSRRRRSISSFHASITRNASAKDRVFSTRSCDSNNHIPLYSFVKEPLQRCDLSAAPPKTVSCKPERL